MLGKNHQPGKMKKKIFVGLLEEKAISVPYPELNVQVIH